MRGIYARVGGRKVFAQYLALALLTGMAFALRADFSEYALAVGGVLGIAVGGIAFEDAQRHRALRRAGGPAPPGPVTEGGP